jgi:hypothetical protein
MGFQGENIALQISYKMPHSHLFLAVAYAICSQQSKHKQRLFRNGPDYKCYYNQFFLRGLPDLTSRMHRLDKPGKRLPNKLKEPDLYEISHWFPLPETHASIETEALSKINSSMVVYSKPLTTPYANRFPRKHHPIQTRSSSIDTVRSRSSASTAPKVVSRGSSENKAFQSQTALQKESDSLQGTLNPSLPVHYDAPSCQEMHLSLVKNTPSLYKTSQAGTVSSNPIENEDNYERNRDYYGHTQDPYSYNKLFDLKESRYKRHQREFPPPFHEQKSQQMKCRTEQFFSFNQYNKADHHEAETAQGGCPGSTEEWAHHPLQEQHASRHPAQKQEQEHQLYYVQHTPGHTDMLHINPAEHHDYNLNIHYAGNKPHLDKRQHNCQVQHQYKDRYPVQHHYVKDSQDHIDSYRDPFEHHDESTVHHAQSSIGLDNHAPAATKGSYPFSSRRQDPRQVPHHHKDQHLSQQQEGAQDTLDHINTYNDAFNPCDYNSNENYARNTQALDCSYRHCMGIDAQYHLQPQHVYEQTNHSGTHRLKNHDGKLPALDKSFSSYIPEDRSPHSHHSLSPLSSLMDSFLDFEPLPSMFDDKSK